MYTILFIMSFIQQQFLTQSQILVMGKQDLTFPFPFGQKELGNATNSPLRSSQLGTGELKTVKIHSQTGAVLIVSLILLVVLTMLGISAIESTKMETRMAANTKDYNQAFQNAEVGIAAAAQQYRGAKINDLPKEEIGEETPKREFGSAETIKIVNTEGKTEGFSKYRVLIAGTENDRLDRATGVNLYLIESEGESKSGIPVRLQSGVLLEIASEDDGVFRDTGEE